MSSNGTSPEQIQADILRQREELAATVDELHARLDVNARARARAGELRERLTTATGRPRPDLTAALAGGVLVVALAGWWRRRRS
jgi:Protein of unknown function (DUF3618)